MKLHRIKSGSSNILTFEVPEMMKDSFRKNIFTAMKNGDWWSVEPSKKKRSTGAFSQNHHGNGHIMQIAQETGNSFDVVKMETKKMACEAGGWNYETLPNGNVWPGSESDATSAQAEVWIECIHMLAADLGIILQEEP